MGGVERSYHLGSLLLPESLLCFCQEATQLMSEAVTIPRGSPFDSNVDGLLFISKEVLRYSLFSGNSNILVNILELNAEPSRKHPRILLT